MKKTPPAKKEIVRDQRFEIRMSKEEKALFNEYAKNLGIAPGRLARNIMMYEAEKNGLAKGVEKATILALRKYYEITKQYDKIEQSKKDY